MLLTILFSLAIAAAPNAVDLRDGAFTMEVSSTKPSHIWPAQGNQTWTIHMTSDGATAWAWAEVKNDPVVFKPPGTPGYMGWDFNAAEELLVWRREAVAVKYDLKGKDTAQICDTKRLHYASAGGGVRTESEPSHALSELGAKQEPVWALVWAALGDESLPHSELRQNQTDPWAEDIVLARHGELAIGTDTLTADLVSFTTTHDPAVATEAASRFAACDGLDVETD